MRSMLKRFREKPELLVEYDKIMKEQLEQGILEVVPCPYQWKRNNRTYYMPHQYVVKESSSTTKLRIVYDDSSGKPSLNDCLYRGKVYAGQFDKSIMAILARVRLMNNVLVMDLQSAFLQIVLDEEDRDSNRLLWPIDPLNSDIPQVLRFTRVTFGIISSPYLLGATLEYHLKKYNEKLAKEI